ncbi:hypothetical protein CXB49_02645 [Chromobacterium sp. ATCC 53434]|uniref:hypothetical protein n=1 Tax=Chromobacterium sp. (strain ATCC 53434 / SC 14030) TaxID=2059672 RepID=UPI000C76A6CC|nr:hypothetical protein [Chromobacterium sp. ATCC 53434]AUH49805.1 hypothetical protein CXB49_02645 [Chromobacterium sp. ATCC 53434]
MSISHRLAPLLLLLPLYAAAAEPLATPPLPWQELAARLRHTYYTGGVHNDKGCLPPFNCSYPRQSGQPSNPRYPKWWVSEWTMYRVFSGYDKYPPPYASPPKGLTPDDYEVSHGASYYDASYVPPDGDGSGAMMEHYDKRCLPIFPGSNHYSCSFVSLGNKAYFLTYDDRLPGMPQCCQFSLNNHPPRQDFIRHLPYNKAESSHLDNSLQAYSRLVGPQNILFGYAFNKKATRDAGQPGVPPYRHPQSFYFSGDPSPEPNAPIVSQNYDNFRAERPDPARTWDQVAQMCPVKPQWCCLFASDCPNGPPAASDNPKSWATLKP